MYDVIYCRGERLTRDPSHCQTVASKLDNLVLANASRSVSGDLVVWSGTAQVVPGDEWLFSWEKKDPNCFARKMQEKSVSDIKSGLQEATS